MVIGLLVPKVAHATEGPVIEWLPSDVLRAAELPDDAAWREVAQALPGWWTVPPNITATPPASLERPDQAWVAVHVFIGGNEIAFAHTAARTLTEAAPAALGGGAHRGGRRRPAPESPRDDLPARRG